MKGELKIKNTINIAKEDAIGQPVEIILKDKNLVPLGVVVYADEDYLYIRYEYDNKN